MQSGLFVFCFCYVSPLFYAALTFSCCCWNPFCAVPLVILLIFINGTLAEDLSKCLSTNVISNELRQTVNAGKGHGKICNIK